MSFLFRFSASSCLPLKTGMYSAVTHNYMDCFHEKPRLATRIIRINGNQVLAEAQFIKTWSEEGGEEGEKGEGGE